MSALRTVVGPVAITMRFVAFLVHFQVFSSIVSNIVVSKFHKGKIDDALMCLFVWCWWYDWYTLTGVFASKAVNPAVTDQGLILSSTNFH
jgi:Amt family ammonium transporter